MKQYNVKARLKQGKKRIDILDGITVQDIINNNFPLCIEAKNKDEAKEITEAICRDINQYLFKCIVLVIEDNE